MSTASAKAAEAFKSATSGHSNMTRQEFTTLVSSKFSPVEANVIFSGLDKNSSGSLQLFEFSFWWQRTMAAEVESNKAFKSADSDGTGGLDVEEFRHAVKEYLKPEEADLVFGRLDENRSGTVELSEFLEWFRGVADHSTPALSEHEKGVLQSFKAHYDAFDTDRTGELSAAEFSNMHANLVASGWPLPPADQVLKSIDANNNGSVQFYEYMLYVDSLGAFGPR
eukprot:Colp12_sorted_trinity150504_noHs@7675